VLARQLFKLCNENGRIWHSVRHKILSQGMVQKILCNSIKPNSKSLKSRTFYHSARARSAKRHKPTREARDERGAFFYIKKSLLCVNDCWTSGYAVAHLPYPVGSPLIWQDISSCLLKERNYSSILFFCHVSVFLLPPLPTPM
jgi:hypothetical protein